MGRRILRGFKWALFVLGALLVLSPLVMVFLARQAEKRLDLALKEISARGEPVKVTQLAPPPVPDKENAALIYKKAFELIRQTEEDKELISTIGSGKTKLDDPKVATQARDILKRNERLLQLLHQASSMPRCDFKRDWSKGMMINFPNFSKLRSSSRILAFESAVLAQQGRLDDALEACGANLRLAKAADEPILISQLVRYAIIAIASKTFGNILRDSQPSAQACRALADEIAKIDLVPCYVETLKGERAMGIWTFDLTRKTPDPMKTLTYLIEEAGKSQSSSAGAASHHRTPVFGRSFFRWYLASDESAYLQGMGKVIQMAPRPYREQRAVLEEQEKSLEPTSLTQPQALTAILLPILSRPPVARDRAIANLGLDEIALLLKAYKAENGAYPDSLASLADFSGRPLPTDPFSGKPFVYRREKTGFLLYSWGQNLKDDGGKPPPPKHNDQGDMVIRCSR